MSDPTAAEMTSDAEQSGEPDGLETSLEAIERAAETALRGVTATMRELKRALAAARTGQVRDLRKALTAAQAAADGLAAETCSLGAAFDFDERAYLASGGFVKELLAEAAAHGLAIVEGDDDRLLCYPSLLRVLPGDAAIEIDKVRDRRLRPSVLVGVLSRAQERGVRFKAEQFLDSVRAAYELHVAAEGKRADAVVRLVDIWSVLTMLPGQRTQYSRQEFARDLYLLDQSGITRTERSPRELHWSASTGTKGAGVLTTVARNGREQLYWGVSFTTGTVEP